MITCPNCKTENPNDAYFCHSCGYKLRKKTNGWRITAILFLILLIVLGCLVLYYNAEIDDLASDSRYYQDRIYHLNNELDRKSATINELENQVQEKNDEISRLHNSYGDYYYYQNQVNSLNRQIEELQSQLPQVYFTKYDTQYFYSICTNGFEKMSCYYPCKGTLVKVYTIQEGYGLTNHGWIPMNCLE